MTNTLKRMTEEEIENLTRLQDDKSQPRPRGARKFELPKPLKSGSQIFSSHAPPCSFCKGLPNEQANGAYDMAGWRVFVEYDQVMSMCADCDGRRQRKIRNQRKRARKRVGR